MSWIITATGKKFDLDNITPDQIDIEDIAEALAKECRFAGHCKGFYSVARHSLLVADNLPLGYRLYGLLHDAPEAYIKDMPSPVKQHLHQYKELETAIWVAIAKKYNLLPVMPDIVKEVDRRLFATERRDLIRVDKHNWTSLEGIEPFHLRILSETGRYDWEYWRDEFLKKFERLMTYEVTVGVRKAVNE